MEPPVELSNKLKEYGQEHLLEFWSELDEASRKHLLDDLMGIDFKEVTSYFTRVNEQDETRSVYIFISSDHIIFLFFFHNRPIAFFISYIFLETGRQDPPIARGGSWILREKYGGQA